MSDLSFCLFSREEAIHWLEHPDHPSLLRGVVSIGDPDSAPPAILANLTCPILRLAFLDRYDSGSAAGVIGPSSVHLLKLEEFARILHPRSGTTLVHCDSGRSRGPSVGWILACFLAGPGSEAPLLNHILAQRPGAGLNPWLITLAQRQFQRFDFTTPALKQFKHGVRR
ncbi:MAG: hypothetical protein HQL89_07520 [Magnetococcales bacterium]|nr:hypothetical protein [Magnetococcales bacterium]